MTAGAYVLWEFVSDRCRLLDMTPESFPDSSDDKEDAALALGRTFVDPTGFLYITPVARGGSGAGEFLEVTVNIGPFPANAAPFATLNGPVLAKARVAETFSVAATDPDGDPLVYLWDFGDRSIHPISPSVSKTFLAGGNYTVSVTVSDMKGHSVVKTQNISVSDPLSVWTPLVSGVTRNLDAALYEGGRWLAGSDGRILFSPDGVSWTSMTTALNFRTHDLAWGVGRFVAAGMNYPQGATGWMGAIFHSPDGQSWNPAAVPACGPLRGLKSGNGFFMATAEDGKVLRSPDGISWSITTPALAGGKLKKLAFGNGVFLGVTGEKFLYRSADGLSWTNLTSNLGLDGGKSFEDIVFHNGVFAGGGYRSLLRSSADNGNTWTTRPTAPPDLDIDSMAAGGGIFLAMGRNLTEAGDPAYTWVSQNGIDWQSNTPPAAARTRLAWGNGYFLAVGANGALERSAALSIANNAPVVSLSGPSPATARAQHSYRASASDSDGDSLTFLWDFGDASPVVPGPEVNGHTWTAGGARTIKVYVSDGRGAVSTATLPVAVSDPAMQWTNRTSGVTANLNDVATGPGLVLAVGDSGTCLRSADGETWSPIVPLGLNIHLKGVARGGARYIAVGQDYDYSISAWVGTILTSPDGLTWETRHRRGPVLHDVASNGSIHVAVGDQGAIWRSTDGEVWNPAPSGVSRRLSSVAHGGDTFVAVGDGDGFSVLRSADGLNWSDASSGAGLSGNADLKYCASAGSLFLASGWYAQIRTSFDQGLSWSATGQADRFETPAMTYANGLYFAGGVNRSTDADIDAFSLDGANWSITSPGAIADRNSAVFFRNTIITVGRGGSIRQSAVITAPSGWSAWVAANFPVQGMPSLPDADPDGDQFNNSLEYALGTNPTSAMDRPALTLTSENGYLTLAVSRATIATDTEYYIERSASLKGPWNNSETTILANTGILFKGRSNFPAGAAPREFLRLRILVGLQ